MRGLLVRRKRRLIGPPVILSALAALVLAAPATAAKPRLTKADRQAINATLDVFVNHAVKRQNAAAAYDVVTPAMRAGMTRKQWSHGSIPVYPYPAAGRHFHGWTVQYHTRDELAIDLVLSPRRGSNPELGQILFNVYLHPSHGRWLVDSFMPGATFAPIGKPGVVQAARDFQANPTAQTYNRPGGHRTDPLRLSAAYAIVPFAIIGLVLLVLAGAWLVSRLRERRLMRADRGTMPRSPLSIQAHGARARQGHRQ
jgi:hypothetical protein